MATGAVSSSDIKTDYLLLLVTQLRNQNPLEPMDNNQMAMQMAQLSQLEQLEQMNSNFGKVLLAQQLGEGSAMIGKTVSFMPSGLDFPVAGRVDGVEMNRGEVLLRVGRYAVGLDEVISVTN